MHIVNTKENRDRKKKCRDGIKMGDVFFYHGKRETKYGLERIDLSNTLEQ